MVTCESMNMLFQFGIFLATALTKRSNRPLPLTEVLNGGLLFLVKTSSIVK